MAKKTKCKVPVKPNMGALHGKIGMSIIETIRNTPKSDHSKLEKECEEFMKKTLAARANGTW